MTHQHPKARLNGLTDGALAAMLKLLIQSTLEARYWSACSPDPALKALVYQPFGKAV